MRASLLRERITFLKEEATRSESGATKKEYVRFHTIKAYRKKQSPIVGDRMNAKESFIGLTLVFQTRYYSFINDSLRVEYLGKQYEMITPPERNYTDNSLTITVQKVND